jgi:hypothetical protein
MLKKMSQILHVSIKDLIGGWEWNNT